MLGRRVSTPSEIDEPESSENEIQPIELSQGEDYHLEQWP